jgi:hypothetical protein
MVCMIHIIWSHHNIVSEIRSRFCRRWENLILKRCWLFFTSRQNFQFQFQKKKKLSLNVVCKHSLISPHPLHNRFQSPLNHYLGTKIEIMALESVHTAPNYVLHFKALKASQWKQSKGEKKKKLKLEKSSRFWSKFLRTHTNSCMQLVWGPYLYLWP